MRASCMSGLMSGIWKRGLRYRARSRLYTPGTDKKNVLPRRWRQNRGFRNTPSTKNILRPFRACRDVGVFLGLKPQAESYHPFGTSPTVPIGTINSLLSTKSTPHYLQIKLSSTRRTTRTSTGCSHEQGMTKSTTSVYWHGVSPDAKGANLYNPILVRYFRRSDRETLSRRRYAGSATLRKQ